MGDMNRYKPYASGPNWKIYCGDSRAIVPTLRFDSVVTDPPYGMAFRSNHRRKKHREIANDRDIELLRWACSIPVRHSRYVCARWDCLHQLHEQPVSMITWVKDNWSMGDLEHEHARQTEIICFWPGPDHEWPGGRRPTDVVRCARTRNDLHPTEKPVRLMMRVVGWTAGTVLDPFIGSGATGVACVKRGRPFVGVELDEEYCRTAARRLREASEGGLVEKILRTREPVGVDTGPETR